MTEPIRSHAQTLHSGNSTLLHQALGDTCTMGRSNSRESPWGMPTVDRPSDLCVHPEAVQPLEELLSRPPGDRSLGAETQEDSERLAQDSACSHMPESSLALHPALHHLFAFQNIQGPRAMPGTKQLGSKIHTVKQRLLQSLAPTRAPTGKRGAASPSRPCARVPRASMTTMTRTQMALLSMAAVTFLLSAQGRPRVRNENPFRPVILSAGSVCLESEITFA